MSKGKTEIKAQLQSAFPLWRKGVPRLGRSLNALRRLEKLVDGDDVPAQLALIDAGLRVNREIRETLMAEMRVRREIAELRKLEIDNATEDELEALLVRTAKRRGYRKLDGMRDALITFLTPSIGAEMASTIAFRVMPAVHANEPRKHLSRTLGASYDRLQAELDAGVQEMREHLEPTSTPQDEDAGGTDD